jgi:hypothetical protein
MEHTRWISRHYRHHSRYRRCHRADRHREMVHGFHLCHGRRRWAWTLHRRRRTSGKGARQPRPRLGMDPSPPTLRVTRRPKVQLLPPLPPRGWRGRMAHATTVASASLGRLEEPLVRHHMGFPFRLGVEGESLNAHQEPWTKLNNG